MPITLAVGPRLLPPAADDAAIGLEKSVAHVPNESEDPIEVPIEVVEENAADAPRLSPVLDKEVLVAPLFEPFVVRGVVPITDRFPDLVEMCGVLVEQVERGQVGASTEPGSNGLDSVAEHLQITHVQVHDGDHRARRVEHQRDPGSVEPLGVDLETLGQPLGQLAGDLGEVHAALLEHVAGGDYPRDPTAVADSLVGAIGPAILAEPGLAVELLEAACDRVLQPAEVLTHALPELQRTGH